MAFNCIAFRQGRICGSLLTWFTDYLSNRTQQVILDGCSLTPCKVLSGVPQESILGPLLFIVYMDQLCSIPLSHSARLQLYADDILLYKPVKDDSYVCDICYWVIQSGLMLNTLKTQLLVISRLCLVPSKCKFHLNLNS